MGKYLKAGGCGGAENIYDVEIRFEYYAAINKDKQNCILREGVQY